MLFLCIVNSVISNGLQVQVCVSQLAYASATAAIRDSRLHVTCGCQPMLGDRNLWQLWQIANMENSGAMQGDRGDSAGEAGRADGG